MLEAVADQRERAVTIGAEGDPFAVGRPCRSEITTGSIGQSSGRARSQVEDPQGSAASRARTVEDDLVAVRGERALIVERWRVRQSLERAAVGSGAIEIRGAAALGGEDDPFAVGRPARV